MTNDCQAHYWYPRALALGLAGTSQARLRRALRTDHGETGKPLALSLVCFADTYASKGSALFVQMTLNDNVTIDEVHRTVQAQFQVPWTKAELDVINKQLGLSHAFGIEQLESFTNAWVDRAGCGAPPFARFQADWETFKRWGAGLDMQFAHIVVARPLTKAATERAELAAASKHRLFEMVTAANERRSPIELPFAKTPTLRPVTAEEVAKLRPDTHDSQSASFVGPGSTIFKAYWGTPGTVPTWSIQALGARVAHLANTFSKDYRERLHALETRGCSVTAGSAGASFAAERFDSECWCDFLFLRTYDGSRDREENRAKHWERAKRETIAAYRSLQKNPMALATHEATQAVLNARPWGFEDAIAYVERVASGDAQAALRVLQSTGWMVTSGSIAPTQWPRLVAPAHPIARARGDPIGCERRLELPTAQTTIVWARPGHHRSTDPTYCVQRRVLQTMLFTSLGSRLYRIRQRTGLFYSASGSLELHASATQNGVDLLSLRVQHHKVKQVLQELDKFQRRGAADLTESELAAAKVMVLSDYARGCAKAGRAYTQLGLREKGFTTQPRDWARGVEALTLGGVQEYARMTMMDGYGVRVVVGPPVVTKRKLVQWITDVKMALGSTPVNRAKLKRLFAQPGYVRGLQAKTLTTDPTINDEWIVVTDSLQSASIQLPEDQSSQSQSTQVSGPKPKPK